MGNEFQIPLIYNIQAATAAKSGISKAQTTNNSLFGQFKSSDDNAGLTLQKSSDSDNEKKAQEELEKKKNELKSLDLEQLKSEENSVPKELEEHVKKLLQQKEEEKKAKLEKEKAEFKDLSLAELKDKLSSIDPDIKYDLEKEVDKKEEKKKEEKENAEKKQKDELKNLNPEDLRNKKYNILPAVKDFFQNLIKGKEKKEKKAKEQNSKECKCKNGNSSEDGQKVCQHAADGSEAARGGGKTDGQEQGSCSILVKAHESAAKHCEQIAKEFGDKVKSCSKGIADTWTKIAKAIRATANTAVWKAFSGGIYATCSSNGKTCYNPKLKDNPLELEKTIVHECIHHHEFQTKGTSDEKDTYNTEKEFAKKLNKMGVKLGGKEGRLG